MYLHQYNIDDMDDKEDLRLKIKKIKYKIEKE